MLNGKTNTWLPSGNTRILGVLGHPISHTLSPAMHNALLRHLQIDAVYLPLPCPHPDLPTVISALRALNFAGANVTIPHKEAVIPHLDRVDDEALFMESVNTLYWENGALCGTSTDAYGAYANLRALGVNPTAMKVAILGAGGSARAVAYGLLRPQSPWQGNTPSSITFFLRDPGKAHKAVQSLNSLAVCPINSAPLDSFGRHSRQFDLLIQTTPLGMHPLVDQCPVEAQFLHAGQVAYDIIYRPQETLFLQRARMRGLRIVEGLGMLLHQGAKSFTHWFPHCLSVDTTIMARALCDALGEDRSHAS